MKQIEGFWWPDRDRTGAPAILRHAKAHFPQVFDLLPACRVAVQAGGNVGVYPARLAERFEQVISFEPDRDNFECLKRNLQGRKNITSYRAALGERADRVGLKRHVDNVGAISIDGCGSVALIRLDDLDLPRCDLIWLDVEGYERNVLIGASATVERQRPAVIVEDMGLGLSARDWLIEHGYREATRMLNDYVMLPQ